MVILPKNKPILFKYLGIGFNNSYGINQNNSINYSASFSNTEYNKKLNNRADDPTKGNSDIYSGSIGYNFSFLDKNLISSKFSYTEKKAKEDELSSVIETKKTPEEVMLALNTNIEELVSLTRLSNSLSQKHIGVAQGMSNDAYTVG